MKRNTRLLCDCQFTVSSCNVCARRGRSKCLIQKYLVADNEEQRQKIVEYAEDQNEMLRSQVAILKARLRQVHRTI
ncbi:Noelin-2 [Frankliniella fusca]|uniref:Noelin-2 n=1 Tax=Frankliniella fusca TaxID=407009 RepID=A0AAE1HF49_9NEOP|nr:Noelin-2 [Frankliniella fusca]